MRKLWCFFACLFALPAFAASPSLDLAMAEAREACGGISDAMADLKRMAGINTAVTGVGTVAGIGATAAGIAKSNVDKEIDALEQEIAELKAARGDESVVSVEIEDDDKFEKDVAEFVSSYSAQEQERSEKEQKSKALGNWRTGLLATNTVTNVAGAVIAGGNKADVDLQAKINQCAAAVEHLTRVRMTSQIDDTADDAQLAQSQDIIRACGDWNMVDLTTINKRARNATVASGVGAGVGLIGTIVSASANSDKDTQGKGNLNAAANVMAGGATVASGAATVFNATQIGAIKRAADVADKCEGAL